VQAARRDEWLCRVPVRMSAVNWVARLIRDEDGQDLVEYALLIAFFGLMLAVLWPNITAAVGMRYGSTRSGIQGLWSTPDPRGAQP
jgi:Flp pilus assembly pilin Flp